MYIQLPVLSSEGIGKLCFEDDLAGKGSAFLVLEAIPWDSEISAISLFIYNSFVSFHHYCFSCPSVPSAVSKKSDMAGELEKKKIPH